MALFGSPTKGKINSDSLRAVIATSPTLVLQFQ